MSTNKDESLSLAIPHHATVSIPQRIYLAMIGAGFFIMTLRLFNISWSEAWIELLLSSILVIAGTLAYARSLYVKQPEGVKNHYVFFRSISTRGVVGWLTGVLLTLFYIALYWYPEYLGQRYGTNSVGLVALFDPLSYLLRNRPADQWFVYGAFYTGAVLLLGIKFLYKYRGNRYQMIRTGSVMFFQLAFSFMIPAILLRLNQPEYYFSYFWPLKREYLLPDEWHHLTQHGGLGIFMFFWGVMMILVATPILTYFFGKRWYCSWVCGCGALAETSGDAFRQLSSKKLSAWKLERWLIYSVLVLVIGLTAVLWINSASGGSVLGSASANYSKWYGFFIGSVFSGVIGTGFYPILGSRSWCRFGCPMAAILGILQKYFSRFRITTNGGQCISCGNCSTYCEMGIDVRSYAQRGQNIVRASCVGCGICSAVCPRGVLKLENGAVANRTEENPIAIDKYGAKMNL